MLAVALFCALLLSGCTVSKMSTLEELSKPFTGVYECTRMTYGGEEAALGKCTLELAYGGGFCVHYALESGAEGSIEGTYSADPSRGEITFTAPFGRRRVSRTFPMREGKIAVEEIVLGKLLRAEFSR